METESSSFMAPILLFYIWADLAAPIDFNCSRRSTGGRPDRYRIMYDHAIYERAGRRPQTSPSQTFTGCRNHPNWHPGASYTALAWYTRPGRGRNPQGKAKSGGSERSPCVRNSLCVVGGCLPRRLVAFESLPSPSVTNQPTRPRAMWDASRPTHSGLTTYR